MSTQAGLDTHINISSRFDCMLSGQYMLHFGKEILVDNMEETFVIEKSVFTVMDVHLLFTISLNYKLIPLWIAIRDK